LKNIKKTLFKLKEAGKLKFGIESSTKSIELKIYEKSVLKIQSKKLKAFPLFMNS
jgi:ribosomal protein L7Ae-like RNA K-turn-binding protein